MVKKIFKVIRWVLALTFISTILAVVVYRFVPVYFTPLMLSRCFEQIGKGESVKLYHDWIPLEKMPKSMPVAVMASEDQRFLGHRGGGRRPSEEREEAARRFYHIPADGEECLSVARTVMAAERPGGVFHLSHRVLVEQAAHHGSLSELYRNG